jgi:hypothetical protein
VDDDPDPLEEPDDPDDPEPEDPDPDDVDPDPDDVDPDPEEPFVLLEPPLSEEVFDPVSALAPDSDLAAPARLSVR